MTVFTLQAPMPPLRLVAGMKMRLQAINPTTGAAVTGVSVSAWTIYGTDTSILAGGDFDGDAEVTWVWGGVEVGG